MAKFKKIESNNHKGWFLHFSLSEDGCFVVRNDRYTISIDYNSIDKFTKDRILSEEDNLIILFDGVAFNREDLCTEYKCQSWKECLSLLWQKEKYDFPKLIKGTFNGIIIDLRKECIIAFSDHIGSHPIFYQQLRGRITISSDIAKILDYNTKSGYDNELDINSAYALLSCGFMLDDNTLCKSIKKLTPGCVLKVADATEEYAYYRLNNQPNFSISESEAIEEIDRLFLAAVNNQYISDLNNRGGI